MRHHRLVRSTGLLAAAVLCAPLHAAQLEEVVVTAQKRGAQRLQDVPAQIQAFTATDLEDSLAVEFIDIANQIPSLQFQDLGPGDREYIIRGVNSTATATVGVYYGEAVITARNKQDGGGRQADVELHDLERVEVLKGPQGTLYGASSMSGTIRFIPNAPDATAFDASIESALSDTADGDFNWRANGMINIPLIEDRLAVRGVGWVTRDGGFVDNVRLGTDDINDNDVDGGRIAIEWNPVSALTLSGYYVRQDREVGGTSRQMPFRQPAYADALETFRFPIPPIGDRDTDSFTITNWDEQLDMFGISGDYDTEWGTFTLASNWFEREILFNFDSTPILFAFGVPIPAITSQPQQRETFTTEARFASNLGGPVEFVVGGFISNEDKDFEVQVIGTGPDGVPLEEFMPGAPNSFFGREKTDDLDQLAVFGEVEWTIDDHWSVLLGGRFYDFEISSDNVETQPFAPAPGTTTPTFEIEDDKFTVKANLTYRFDDDRLVYATASQGFRPGGTNDVAFIAPGDPVPPAGFGPDELWNYELGWKTTFYDGRLSLNGAVFAIRWDDIQVSTFEPGTPFNVVRNEGEASIDGIELALRAMPLEGLDLFAGFSWQDARFTSDIPGSGPDQPFADDGDDIPNVPDFQFTASGQYQWPVTAGINAMARLEWSFQDDRIIAPNDPVLNVDLDSYHLLNANAGLLTDRWKAVLFVKNLTDEEAVFDAINTTQDPRAILTARPRTVGFNFRYQF